MAFEFRFPDVGEGITEGEVVRWLVSAGDAVRADQILAEVETDKAVVEIPSPRTGTIAQLGVEAGEKIHVGEVLVVIAEDGAQPAETFSATLPETSSSREAAAAASTSVVGALQEAVRVLPPPPELVQVPAPAGKAPRILAIPSVRKLARELGVNLTQVTPTGPRGRLRREDVLQAANAPSVETAGTATPAVGAEQDEYGPIDVLELAALRRTIATAMVHAASTAVPITTTDEVDVTALVALRQQSKDAAEAEGVNVTLLPFVMKAVVAALRQHPHLNATLADSLRQMVLKRYYHLGIATDTADGLIVPVIRDVDRKNILTLATELQQLTTLARERRVALADLRGGTFTISNYGAIGGIFATPMLHMPQVAILGVGKLLQKPVVHEGDVAIRTILPLSLTFDHRALDGATAQRFLNTVMGYLANPARLLLVL